MPCQASCYRRRTQSPPPVACFIAWSYQQSNWFRLHPFLSVHYCELYKTLWIELLSASLSIKAITILWMWIWEGNCGIVPTRMLSMERADKEIERRYRFKEGESWNITRRLQSDQIYNGIGQGNKSIEVIKCSILDRIAEMGQWATMEELNNKRVERKVYSSWS